MTRLLLLLVLLAAAPAAAQPVPGRLLVDLSGSWRFQLGDNGAWAAARFDDRAWDVVRAPSAWENEGFPGYDGYAWYRRHFRVPAALRGRRVLLVLGRVDDADEVYLNGRFIGSTGRFPPDYETAFAKSRAYLVPADYLNYDGDNVVAVRVFDERLEGGLLEGPLGLAQAERYPAFAVDLSGRWEFRTGDRRAWRDGRTDRAGWRGVTVPGAWEPQGFRGYDGYAWYRRTFVLPREWAGRRLVLALGRVDDLDEVFLNGHRVGSTGRIDEGRFDGSEWLRERRYEVPAEVLRPGATNVIAVRVFDGLFDGGLRTGPVGLLPPEALPDASLLDRLRAWWEAW